MNRLELLKHFCTVAETLHFKEAANRLAVSPQVVTRAVTQLENTLGDVLFQRNTRNVRLTAFGEQFYTEAKQYLADGERLFALAKPAANEMAGVVRITLPMFMQNAAIIKAMLQRSAPYPKLILDWRTGENRANAVEEQIDVGVRIGIVQDNRFVVKRICPMGMKVVATPALLDRLGKPQDLQDLQKNYPLTAHLNGNTGRLWAWQFKDGVQFTPKSPRFIASGSDSDLAAALSGEVFSQLSDHVALPYLKRGELVSVLDDYAATPWELFVYRPPQTLTPARVKQVFDWLVDILQAEYAGVKNA